jgi:AcrR family transcriptional regulator
VGSALPAGCFAAERDAARHFLVRSPFDFRVFNTMINRPSPPEAVDSKRRTERRQAILETAARLFAQEGYTGCDMERLAAELGIAKGTLYLYFPGKQELFFSCVDWGMSHMQEAVRAAAQSVADPYLQIARAIRAYLAFFEEHPEYVELLIQERAMFKDRKRPTYFEYRDANRGYWRDLYTQLIADGQLRADLPPDRIVDTIGSLLYGTMFTNHFIGRSVTLDEQYRALLEIIFRGILSDDQRRHLGLPEPEGDAAESPLKNA